MTRGSDVRDLTTQLRRVVRLLPEGKPLLPRLFELIGKMDASGKRVHCTAIVTAAVVHRVGRIVTLNLQDYSGFSALAEIADPESVLGITAGSRDSGD